jgi:peptide/nickel transport system permease protein
MNNTSLKQAQDLLQKKDRSTARKFLIQLIKEEPRNVQAWMLLAEAVDTKDQAIYCLEYAFKLDPQNSTALKWLTVLSPEKYLLPEPEPPSVPEIGPPQKKPSLEPADITAPDETETPRSPFARPDSEPIEPAGIEERVKDIPPVMTPAEETEPPYYDVVRARQAPPHKPLHGPEIAYLPPSRAPEPLPEPGPSTRPEAHLSQDQIYQIRNKLDDEQIDLDKIRPKKRFNWPLLIGILSLGIFVFLAFAGPFLAPHDPLEENLIIKVNDEWQIPPFDPFTEGFFFGSDMFGRDIFSRILWAAKPTLIMVVIVAFVRLVIGTIIGLLAGWTSGRIARALDTIIEAAIAIPILLVALCAIAVIGVEYGIWAFIIGLSINGWVETSQQVREQTHIVKGQAYIEAAHAQGATNIQILIQHVLKQIAPMTVMLFAFEMSSTLMTTAGLGFLGYYIGGDVWVDVEDFVARRISGMPELGQMLATSWTNLTQPWGMVAVGTTMFLAVLGLNLLGEGFRQRLNLMQVRRRGIIAQAGEKASFWFNQYLIYPLSLAFDKPAVRIAISGALLLILVWFGTTNIIVPELRSYLEAAPVQDLQMVNTTTKVPGTESPQAAAIDIDQPAPTVEVVKYTPEVIWELADETGFLGGPTTSPDGNVLYAATRGGTLYAFTLDGEEIWQTSLITSTVGSPQVDSGGNIYVTDITGGLTAVNSNGEISWYFMTRDGYKAVSPVVISQTGEMYYTVTPGGQGFIQAVSPNGESLWISQAKTSLFYRTPDTSADGQYVFLRDDIFDSQTGALLEPELDIDVLRYFGGDDGNTYFQAGNNVILWEMNGNKVEIIEIAELNSAQRQSYGNIITPIDTGVLADGTAWLLYSTPGGSTEFIWVTLEDELLGIIEHNFSQGQLVEILDDKTAIICGGKPFTDEFAECAAYIPGAEQPIWEINLGRPGLVQGGVWVSGHLYLTTLGGQLFAIGVTEEVEIVEIATETPPPVGEQASRIEHIDRPKPDEPGIIWSYQIPAKVKEFYTDDDGVVYVLTLKNDLYIIEPDGTHRTTIKIDPSPFRVAGNYGNAGPFIWPKITSDGTVIVISNADIVYALDSSGEKLWEYEMQDEPHSLPPHTEIDIQYMVDTQGSLYAFDTNGLRWQYQPEEALYTAAGIVIGPNGNLYYTITDRKKTYVVSVSPDGEKRWATQVKTQEIYDPVEVTVDGRYVFLNDDAFDATTGELFEFDIPMEVNEFIPGLDGRTYLRSGHTVMEWKNEADGFQLLQTEAWHHDAFDNFDPRSAGVDENQLIWMFYEGNFTAGYGTQLVWVTLQGDVKRSHFWSSSSQRMAMPDYQNSRIIECSYIKADGSLVCELISPDEDTSVWDVTVPEIPAYEEGFIQGEYIYLKTLEDQVVAIFIGSP